MPTKAPSLLRLIQSDYACLMAAIFPLVFWGFHIALLLFGQPIASFEYVPIVVTAAGILLLVWRYHTIVSVFSDGLQVTGTICSVLFYGDRGKIEYIYSVDGAKYQSGNAVHKSRRAESFQIGTEVVLLVDRNNPKRAFVRDLYADSVTIPSKPLSGTGAPTSDQYSTGVEFRGLYDRDCFQKAVFLIGLPSKRNQLFRLVLSALLLLGASVTLVETILQGQDTSEWLVRIGITSLVAIYLSMLPYVNAFLAARNLWRDPAIRTSISGLVTSQGITYVAGEARNEIRWEKFAKLRKTKEWIALLTVEGTFALFPQNFFQSNADWEIFSNWAAAKVVMPK